MYIYLSVCLCVCLSLTLSLSLYIHTYIHTYIEQRSVLETPPLLATAVESAPRGGASRPASASASVLLY